MTIEEIFAKSTNNNKALTLQEFNAIVNAESTKPKFTDLSEGKYVDRQKYLDDLAKKDTQIESLNDTLKTRDTDLVTMQEQLTGVQAQLEAGGTDASKLAEMTSNLEALQEKYTLETGELQKKLESQAYEFAVRDYANGQKFSSTAAKRNFIDSMKAKNLPMEDGTIIGADDFVKLWKKDNADAFYQEPKKSNDPKPHFSAPTPGKGNSGGKMSLSEMMRMKNENPNAVITFE